MGTEKKPAQLRSDSCELEKLKLTPEEREALKTQGFISLDLRGNRSYYKLRFRCAGRQRVKYIGPDEERANRIRKAIVQCRKEQGLRQEISLLNRAARALLRQLKETLAPVR